MEMIGKKLNSHAMSVFEVLALSYPTSLTIPQIVNASAVPSSTVARIIDHFEEAGVIAPTGKIGKAILWLLDANDYEVVEIARSVNEYVARVTELDGLAHGIAPAGPSPTAQPRVEFIAIRTIRHEDWAVSRNDFDFEPVVTT